MLTETKVTDATTKAEAGDSTDHGGRIERDEKEL